MGGGQPPPRSVTLLLHFSPVDKSWLHHCHSTGIATGHKDPCPPFPRWSESKTFEGGSREFIGLYPQRILPQTREGPFCRSVASLPRSYIVYVCSLHFPLSLCKKHTFSMNMYFLLTFFYWQCPPPKKKSTQSVHQIVQFQSKKWKSSFVWDTPLPDPPPARALCALACVFTRILQILPPHEQIPAYGLGSSTPMHVKEPASPFEKSRGLPRWSGLTITIIQHIVKYKYLSQKYLYVLWVWLII